MTTLEKATEYFDERYIYSYDGVECKKTGKYVAVENIMADFAESQLKEATEKIQELEWELIIINRLLER